MAGSGYVNPLRRVGGLIPQRIDQGVDFTGSGPIAALGSGTVINAASSSSGWPGGGWISYRLDSGPDAGRVVYVAEEITPTARAGQRVSAGQTIANLHGFMETGWGSGIGEQPLSQTAGAGGISGANLPPGGTKVGFNFEQLLVSLGVKRAPNFGVAHGGKLPSGLIGTVQPGGNPSSTSGGIVGSVGQGLIDGLLGSLGISSLADFFERAALVIFGLVLLIVGVYKLTDAGTKAKKAGGTIAMVGGTVTGQPELAMGGQAVSQRAKAKEARKREREESENEERLYQDALAHGQVSE